MLAVLAVLGAAAGAPGTARAQTPAGATLTQWDIFAATGGDSLATQNPLAVALTPASSLAGPDGTLWFVAQRPFVRLGRLDPITNSYREWRPAEGLTLGVPHALAVHGPSGDVWLSTGGAPEIMVKVNGGNTFRTIQFPVAGTVQALAVSADGATAYAAVRAGGQSFIYAVPRPGGAGPLTITRWRFQSSSDDPRDMAVDSAGKIWWVNRFRNLLVRFDPTLSSPANQTKWQLPPATPPPNAGLAGLHIVDGPSGAASVCVVGEWTLGTLTGEVMCLDVTTNTLQQYTRPTPPGGFDFPQRLTRNAAGEIFLTEQNGDAVSFLGQAGLTPTSTSSLSPLAGTSGGTLLPQAAIAGTVTDATVAPEPDRLLLPSVTAVTGTEAPTGQVRFALPLSGPSGTLRARPVGITPVIGDTGVGTGTVYIAQYFDGATGPTQAGAIITKLELGAEAPDAFQVLPSSLAFEADISDSGQPAGQMLSIEKQGGGTLAWTATKTQSWLTLTLDPGDTPCADPPPGGACSETTATLHVSVDRTGLTVAGSPYADTITIDDGPDGAAAVLIPVTVTITAKPTIVVSPALLQFTAINSEPFTPPGPQPFTIDSQGGTSPLQWTATLNLSVPARLEVNGEPQGSQVSGEGLAVVAVRILEVPGAVPNPNPIVGSVVITSKNATNSGLAVVNIEYLITTIDPFAVQPSSLSFEANLGEGNPAAKTFRLSNRRGDKVVWGTTAPDYLAADVAPMPSWITFTPSFGEIEGGGFVDISVSVNASSFGFGSQSAIVTIDDEPTPTIPAVTLGVALTIKAGVIAVEPESLSFDATHAAGPTTKTFDVTNPLPGDAPIHFTPQVVMTDAPGAAWLSVSPSGPQSVAPGGSLTFTVSAGSPSLAPGEYNGSILVADPNSRNGSKTVAVLLTVTDRTGPVLTLPDVVSVEATGGAGAVVSYDVSANDAVDGPVDITCSPASGSQFALGSTSVACSATDAADNTTNGSFSVVVSDTTPPVITSVPASQTIEATSTAGAVAIFAGATATDAVGPVTITYSPESGATFTLGTTTVVVTARDGAGNTSTAAFTITVVDTTPPAITSVPPGQTIEATSAAGAGATFGGATATDAVGPVTITYSPESGTTFAIGTTTVVVTAADGAGNAGTAAFTITVVDTTPPDITVPTPAPVVEADGPFTSVTFTVTAADVVDGAVAVSCSPVSGSLFPVGQTTVDCLATDARNNTASASFVVTVRDTTPPVFTFVPGDQTLEAAGPAGALATFAAATATDAAGPVAITYSHASGSTFPLGVTVVVVTATDGAGLTSTASFRIEVVDTTPPAITVPDTLTVAATGPATTVDFTVTALDLVDGPVDVACTPPSGSGFPAGTAHVTCTAVDIRGNDASAGFDVVVIDNVPPVITVPPAPVVTEAAGELTEVTFTVTVLDVIDDEPTVTCTPASGSQFPVGTTNVSCTAEDASGNTATAPFTVTVVDTTPPSIVVPSPAPVVEATGPATEVSFTVTASDLVDGDVAVSCTPASGSSFALGQTTVNCSAMDAHGNPATASFVVTVEDTTGPAITVPTPAPIVEATGTMTQVIFTVTASDLVDGSVVATCSPASGSQFPLGDTEVSCSASDTSGNTTPETFVVTVRDSTPPVITSVPANQTLEATGPTGAIATYAAAAATDAVGPVTITYSQASGATFPLGTTTVVVTAKDDAGNESTASFTIDVVDTTPPTLTVPDDITVDSTGSGGAEVTFTATAADLVSGSLTPVCTPAPGSTFPVGTTTVTCTATDAAGNAASDTFSVTVEDAALEGHMTGAGYFDVSHAARLHFRFGVRERARYGERGHLRVTIDFRAHHVPSQVFVARTITSVAFSDDLAFKPGRTWWRRSVTVADSVVFRGTGDWNRQPGYTFEVRATDRGEPGKGRDTFGITIWSPAGVVVAAYEDVLDGGNIQSHRLPGRVPPPPDETAPSLDLPRDIVEEADGPAGADVRYRVSARDDRDGRVEAVCTAESGGVFPLGTTTVDCMASDDAGNVAHDSFTITVRDTRDPDLDLPKNITVRSASPMTVFFNVSAEDEVTASPTVACAPPSGSVFPLGMTTVTCTATDAAGNETTGSFRVTVKKR